MINAYPTEQGRSVTGNVEMTLVSSKNVTLTKEFEARIVVIKNL